MPILTSADYPAIRAALDLSLDAEGLPDAAISLPLFQGMAEAEVLRRDPDAASRTGDELQHVRNAAVLLTAGRIAPRLPQVLRERFAGGDYEYQMQPRDWEALATSLRADAEAELSAYLAAAQAPEAAMPPTVFGKACVRPRRRSCW